jgi:hypothetical protein
LLPACLPTSTTGRRGEEGGGEGPVANAPVRRSATTPLTSLSRPASSLEPDAARATGNPDDEQLLILPLGRLNEPSYGPCSKAALPRPGTSLARDAPETARPADGSRVSGSPAGRHARRCVFSSCRRTCVGGPERTRATDSDRRRRGQRLAGSAVGREHDYRRARPTSNVADWGALESCAQRRVAGWSVLTPCVRLSAHREHPISTVASGHDPERRAPMRTSDRRRYCRSYVTIRPGRSTCSVDPSTSLVGRRTARPGG